MSVNFNPYENYRIRVFENSGELRNYKKDVVVDNRRERVVLLIGQVAPDKFAIGYDIFFADGRRAGRLPSLEFGYFVREREAKLYFVGYFYYLTHSISDKLCIYISHTQQTCTKISIKKSNEGAVRAYWQVSIEKMVVSLFLLSSHFSLVWSCFLSNFYPRISSDFGLIIWHEAAMFDIFSNRR